MRRDARFSTASILALLLLLLLPAAAPADWGWGDDRTRETETFEETVGVAGDAPVRVRTTNGTIEVETWDRDEVRVYAEKKAHARSRDEALEMLAETGIRIEESGGGLSIEVDRPDRGWGKRGGVSVSFRLSVPRGASIEARSTNGGIEIDGVAGGVSADTTNGGVSVENVGGDVDIETTNGAIKAYGIGGALDARTTNGSIDAEVLAESLSDDMRLSTTNGSIDLELAAGLAASVEARAGNGRVYNDLASGSIVREKRNEAVVDLGGGGPRIEVRTANGRIRLRERG